MEIVPTQNRQEFLSFLPRIKSALPEWQFVEIRLVEDAEGQLSAAEAASMVQELFAAKEGKIYICNAYELLMLIHWGKENTPKRVSYQIETHLPEGTCEVFVHDATAQGLMKLELLIKQPARKPLQPAAPAESWELPTFAEMRERRSENVVLIADDDMYMRMLIKKGLQGHATLHEVADGADVTELYKKLVPDLLFLDIHLPGKSGPEILAEILSADPKAHVIMVSADSSRENVGLTLQRGAKGFLAKPFTKEKLLEHLKKCPTVV